MRLRSLADMGAGVGLRRIFLNLPKLVASGTPEACQRIASAPCSIISRETPLSLS